MDNIETTIEREEKKERMLVAGTAGLIVFVLLALTVTTLDMPAWMHLSFRTSKSPSGMQAAVASQEERTDPNAFSDISITGRAAFVIDLSTETVLFEKNARTQLPLASLTKIMTALVAADALDPDAKVVITEAMLTPEGDSGLHVGDAWSITDLVALTLIASSNDGAEALAESAELIHSRDIASLMNEKARQIGLTETFFANPTGLDVSGTQGGSYGSARDIAQLFAYAVRKHLPVVEYSKHASYTGRSAQGAAVLAANTNELVNTIPGLIASKTGFTDLAGGNLAIVFDRGLAQPVVVVVLGSTQEGRFSDVAALVRASEAYYHTSLAL